MAKDKNNFGYQKKKIGVVAIGYNRLKSMSRLMHFLESANYSAEKVPLIISLDFYEDDSIRKFATEFYWSHGEKILRFQTKKMGLREHILQCGNYVNEYDLDAIIVFEDDIIPAWDYYSYVEQAVEKFGEDEKVAGIALYSHRLNPNGILSFEPAHSQYDNFFVQYACSWGQVWTRTQWNCFFDWYCKNMNTSFHEVNIPENISKWPDSSWLKYHIKYCVENEKYFVYPYISLATNFQEEGTHVKKTDNRFQVSLLEGKKEKYYFGNINEAVKYDVFFERIGIGKEFGIEERQLCVDLYGKQPEHRMCRFWMTSEKLDYLIIKQFGNVLKVKEENILYRISGKEIFLYDTTVKRENDWNDMGNILKEGEISAGHKGLVLAGAGDNGRRWMNKLYQENIEVLCFADADKKKIGQSICGKKIVSFDELKKIQDKICIFITVANERVKSEIECILSEKGLYDQIVKNPYIDSEVFLDSHVYNSTLEGNNVVFSQVWLLDSFLGRYSYVARDSRILKTRIGRFTCIGQDVKIISGQHPTSGFVSIHPAFYSIKNAIGYSFVQNDKYNETRKADQDYAVVIGNDVWIGMGVSIMEGVTIADGSVIAAGAVVIKDTEPFEIVGGVPARHIRYRFEEKERIRLLDIKWWNKDFVWIKEHAEEFEDISFFMKGREKEND